MSCETAIKGTLTRTPRILAFFLGGGAERPPTEYPLLAMGQTARVYCQNMCSRRLLKP